MIKYLQLKFALKVLGKLHNFLGIEAHWDTKGVLLTQFKYISDTLAETNTQNCKPVRTPMDCTPPKPKMEVEEKFLASPCDESMYRHMVGSLQYLSLTRLDLAFVVSKVAQHMHAVVMLH